MNSSKRPQLITSVAAMTALIAVWGAVRLLMFSDRYVPLTYVVPLLLIVWTRRLWQLWTMAGVFSIFAVIKTILLKTSEPLGPVDPLILLAVTLFNVWVGAGVIYAIVRYRERTEASHERIILQNAELERQAEELAQQNEEIRNQGEEMAQQYEEIESQSEELATKNHDLDESNRRLLNREDLLQILLQATRTTEATCNILRQVCTRGLEIIGAPAQSMAILEREEQQLVVRMQAVSAGNALPERWPLEGSIGHVILEQDRTAYVSDLALEPKLSLPFGQNDGVGSILATPLHLGGTASGMIVVCSRGPAHWSDEQFKLIEWLAAQCGLILEVRRGQDAIHRRMQETATANEAKDRFLAMLSHELRTPLTPVLAAAGALAADQSLPAPVREDLAMIARNVAVQNRLIDDLLDLTRITKGKMNLQPQKLSLRSVIQEAIAITNSDLDARDLRLVLRLGALNGCGVLADGARLQQVFWNLLKNAVKFSQPGGEILVNAERTDSTVRISIVDRGVGLAAADLERIFRPFEQIAQAARPTNSGGLGLGLAIAKAITELHQGVLRAESAGENQGASFIVELPVFDLPESRPPQTPSSPPVVPKAAGLRILLVEDHRDTGRVLSRLLQSAGHTVTVALNGASALAAAEAAAFDLVISDIGLPDLDGYELMAKIRALLPKVTGICMSGYGSESDVSKAVAAGFQEHLTKPVDLQNLYAAIGRVRRPAVQG